MVGPREWNSPGLHSEDPSLFGFVMERTLSPVRSRQVRHNKLQEGKKHHQAAYFAKADKGHPQSAKQKYKPEMKAGEDASLPVKYLHTHALVGTISMLVIKISGSFLRNEEYEVRHSVDKCQFHINRCRGVD
jgi:hypothetical protein